MSCPNHLRSLTKSAIKMFVYLLWFNILCSLFCDFMCVGCQAGATCVFLYGCVGCSKKVFSSEDKSDSCEICGSARYDAAGKPRSKQRVIHFPLKSRLRSLLGCEKYVQSVRYEHERAQKKRNAEYMSGIHII